MACGRFISPAKMSSQPTSPALTWSRIPAFPALTLASQEFIDQAQQHEMARLRNGGDHPSQTEDFTFYVLLPLLLLLGLMVVGRRFIS